MSIVLCHKCSGTFERVVGLGGCCCMSGYYRGFEKSHSLETAATEQLRRAEERLQLYIEQGRNESYLKPEREYVAKRLDTVLRIAGF